MNTIKIELKLDNQGLADLLQSMLIKGLQLLFRRVRIDSGRSWRGPLTYALTLQENG